MNELTQRFGIGGTTIHIKKEQTDPLCMRISIGGLPDYGGYLTYRGDNREHIKTLLKVALKAFDEYDELLKAKGE